LNLFPSPVGQLELVAAGGISALQPTGMSVGIVPGASTVVWSASTLNLSDANPASVPGSLSPLSYFGIVGNERAANASTSSSFLDPLRTLFFESGSYIGDNATTEARQGRHAASLLHRDDKEPVKLYAMGGDISGLTLFTPKLSRLFASRDITDVALYIQNLLVGDLSIVSAGRDLVLYNTNSQLRARASSTGNAFARGQTPLAGDLQISGPGVMQVLAGRNLDLGSGDGNGDGTGAGITSIGNFRNPFLSASGASIIVGAGLNSTPSLGTSRIGFSEFINRYLLTAEGRKHLEEVAPGVDYAAQDEEEQSRLALEVFYLVLRDTGRDFNDPKSPGFGNYAAGTDAIATLFGDVNQWDGEILTQNRSIRTRSGGSLRVLSPGGGVSLAETAGSGTSTPPGIITEAGGGVSLFTDQDVSIGVGRIFTLRGGDIVIWSSRGDIAAGSSSRTIQSAPPTRVVIDPQSASVQTDLAGLATGGGIGVLATVEGVASGDVDLIAPAGTIDAGDAGIRVTGNINLAAVSVVNAGNISAGGSNTGAPSATVSSPSISAVTSASNATAATTSTAANAGESQRPSETNVLADETPSLYTVEVIGYGGGRAEEDEEEDRLRKAADEAETR
jgi:filamentous hemagglutinin